MRTSHIIKRAATASSLTTPELTQLLSACDAAIVRTRERLVSMSTLFKLKSGIPLVRDLTDARTRIVTELNKRRRK